MNGQKKEEQEDWRPALKTWLVYVTKKLLAHSSKKMCSSNKNHILEEEAFSCVEKNEQKASYGRILDGRHFFYLSKKDKRMKKYESLRSLVGTIIYTNRHIMGGERERSAIYFLLGVVM